MLSAVSARAEIRDRSDRRGLPPADRDGEGRDAPGACDAQQHRRENINKYREDYPTKALQFPYRFESNTEPFYVSAIYNDGKFTYIQASPQETPALYEVKDGKPNLIDFQFRNGTYVVPKILDSGYLDIGKARFQFEQ